MLARLDWYREQRHRAAHRRPRGEDRPQEARSCIPTKVQRIGYDIVVLATGSYPFVPPVPGINNRGVFVYRTIEDLERIMRLRPATSSGAR